MKRRASGMDFALVWGEVKAWGQQDQDDLVKLIQGVPLARVEAKTRAPRKPKPGAPEGGTP